MIKRFANIRKLLQKHLLTGEHAGTEALIEKLKHIKQRGYFRRGEFLEMCGWKSPRKRAYYESNSAAKVKEVSQRIFATRSECERIILLDSLEGVGIPVASAILMLTDPHSYGVIDIRVWQLLYLYGEVGYNPKGTGLSAIHWLDYLPKLRFWANEFGVGARNIERTLFRYHKDTQEGNLYE